ncbi:MAG: cyanophycinase [Planctomycetes bacterium]|nr:cyanophycinase [Planctomycetota bacterium]
MPRRYLGLVFPFLLVVMPGQGPIDPGGLPGTRLLGGGGKLPDTVYARFLELAGGSEKARIVLIPTASGSVDDADELEGVRRRWQHDHPGFRFELLHTRDRTMADDDAFTAPLRKATGVWLGGGVQKNLADAYLGTLVERELMALLARGGVIGGTSAGTAIQTRTMIESGKEQPIVATGFDFVPGAISDQHFLKRNRLPRLLRVLGDHPGHFGIGVDEGTAVEIRGRELRVLGDSLALLVLAAGNGHDQRVVELAAGDQVDLVSWQRAAAARAAVAAPPRPTAAPNVPHGALLLVGGGPIDGQLIDRFVELAGGETAKVVLVPSAAAPGRHDDEPIERWLRQRGVRDVRTLDCASPREVTAARLALLDDATAVWFGGGRQWRFVDAFAGTPAIAAFHAVLQRGGVIGGNSAGATIQGEFLVGGDALSNTELWCEGYDRGFGFLPGVAIDHHFMAQDRTNDLVALMARLPGWVGLGIDEGAAVIVQGTLLEVLGSGKVAVLDHRTSGSNGAAKAPPPRWLTAGGRFDLGAR